MAKDKPKLILGNESLIPDGFQFERLDLEAPFPDVGEKTIFYGRQGTGKTYAAHTAPGPIFTLCVGPRNEIKTLRSVSFREDWPDQEIYPVNALENLGRRGMFKEAIAYDLVTDYLDRALELRAKGNFPSSTGSFKTLIIDNATVLYYYGMFKVLELGASGTGSKESKAAATLRENNILIPVDYDYKGEMSLAYQLYSWLYQMEDLNVILIAHEYESFVQRQLDGDNTGRAPKVLDKVQPAFTGKNRESIPALFDNVWHFTTQGGGRSTIYKARTINDSIIYAKTRVGGILPEFYYPVNMTEAISKLIAAEPKNRRK